LGFFEGHRVCGTPFEVREYPGVDLVDLCSQWARHTPGVAQDLRQNRDIACRERVPTRPKGVVCFPVVKEDCGLALPDDELCTELDFAGALCGNPMDHLLTALVKPLDDFEKNGIVRAHPYPLILRCPALPCNRAWTLPGARRSATLLGSG